MQVTPLENILQDTSTLITGVTSHMKGKFPSPENKPSSDN